MSDLEPGTAALLNRPIEGQIHFSDVFPEAVGPDQDHWWRQTDFDSGLTVAFESSGAPDMAQIPIGERPWVTDYGLVLVDDLVADRAGRTGDFPDALHPDQRRELERSGGAVIALANFAPRDDANTQTRADGSRANGSDFYLATTTSGLEVVTTPLSFLGGLEARDRIVSLHCIPTDGHPEFREGEQFRSAGVVRSRRHSDHLDTVFDYASREDLIEAKKDGSHPDVIPIDSRTGRIAYVDKFGNTRAELADARSAGELEEGQIAGLVVRTEGKEVEVGVVKARDLRSAPLGQLAVYRNVSDGDGGLSGRDYLEVIARVNGNPSTAGNSAIYQLLDKVPELADTLGTAEVELVTA